MTVELRFALQNIPYDVIDLLNGVLMLKNVLHALESPHYRYLILRQSNSYPKL